jgi:hypothetical protein
MQKWLMVILFLTSITILTISLTFSPVLAEHTSRYNNTELGISIVPPYLPLKWLGPQIVNNIVIFAPPQDPNSLSLESLDIKVENLTGSNLNLDEYATATLDYFINNNNITQKNSFKLLSTENTTIGGIPALQKHYTFSIIEGPEIEALHTFLISNNFGYTILFSSNKEIYANYIEHIQFIINSFEIIK